MKISVWLFDDAPQKYQDMSRHSDENWVVVFHDMLDYVDLPSPFYQLLPSGANWDAPDQQQERDYAESWGFIQQIHDGNDLIAITAHS